MQHDDHSALAGSDSEADDPSPAGCYHCGEALPARGGFYAEVLGSRRAMCCAGCAAVATTIVQAGLGDYYRLRTELPSRAEERVPSLLEQAAVYRRPALEEVYARQAGRDAREAHLLLEGIECAACAWLVERTLLGAAGTLEASVNFSTHRATVRWDVRETSLGSLMAAVARLGYRAQPYDPARREAALSTERRARLRRLGIAALFGAQIMMLAVVLYAGAWWGIEPEFESFFRWSSLVLAIPVVAYAAWPFFTAAARGLANRAPGMDLPVALGIGTAFAGSAYATVTGRGEVYFDSVAMFTFFLLLARHLEFLARKRAHESVETLVTPVPELARRLSSAAEPELLPVAELIPGDRVRVLPGETVPADGVVSAGASTVDESLLTGESHPLARRVGDPVLGGSLNGESPLEIRVERIGAEMAVSRVLALVERAAAMRPRLARLAERVAGAFVLVVVAAAAGVALYWWHVEPQRWLPITIAVLVATCPCALSLATPTALTAAASALTAHGMVPARGLALEALARVDQVVFDKTGTLTRGHYRLLETRAISGTDAQPLLRVAVALERHSEHPIARGIEAALTGPVAAAERVHAEAGRGISGEVAGERWWLGAPRWVCTRAGVPMPGLAALGADGASVVLLAGSGGQLCAFALGDPMREGAVRVVRALRERGIRVALYSGDQTDSVAKVAHALGIEDWAAELLPEDKLARLQALGTRGRTTLMVGDGINDAPTLAGASVSVAMGGGARAARASADFILVSDRLPALLDAIRIARRARSVVRENMGWAIAYNALALPAAASGLVAPWMAAIGMSVSSLLVVGNSMRLSTTHAGERRTTARRAEPS